MAGDSLLSFSEGKLLFYFPFHEILTFYVFVSALFINDKFYYLGLRGPDLGAEFDPGKRYMVLVAFN